MATLAQRKELLNEIQNLIDVYYISFYDPLNHSSLRAAIFGPPGSPYAGGQYDFHMEIPFRYPYETPMITFKTKIWHPNIDAETGQLGRFVPKPRDYKYELKETMEAIVNLLKQPNNSNSSINSVMNPEAQKMFKEDLTAFERKAQEWAVKFARAPDPEAKYAGYNRDLIQRYVDMGFGTDAVVEAFKYVGIDRNHGQDYTLEEAYQGDNGNENLKAYGIVLKLLRAGAGNDKNVSQPLRKDGDMPTSLPFLPLQEEMSTRQFYTTKDQDWTAGPEKEANQDGVDMTYGATLAVLSLIESFHELGVDKNDTY
ncbi:hypothetical protein FANTH_1941 [Fusarium anthophilum]|uniref:UBC core domain-containing protein n=1 Tax=Fusarium anthophilum TaxID=48485 RepID=A0A8H4ZW50_9HYPO|nr:hypothetical protein FANTH_1941 [Fusarium anthophilum]